MSSDSKLIVEVWDTIRDIIPAGKRDDAALRILRLFEEYGFEIQEAEGEDKILDEALELLREDEDEDEVDELNF
jgi:hypothetical protein